MPGLLVSIEVCIPPCRFQTRSPPCTATRAPFASVYLDATRASESGDTDAELSDLGVTEVQHDRLDAALVRALAGSGAGLVITPGGHQYVDQGIAALLRYTDASTPI